MARAFRLSPLLLAIALTPAKLQVSCDDSGNPTLASLEIEAAGLDRVVGFSGPVSSYEIWTTSGVDTIVVRATTVAPSARVNYRLMSPTGDLTTGGVGTGGGEVTLGVTPDSFHNLQIDVSDGGARKLYLIDINPECSGGECNDNDPCTSDACVASSCEFAPGPDGAVCDSRGMGDGLCSAGSCEYQPFSCTEQGVRDAIMSGGGPHTFACNGPTTVVTQAEIVIDNDVVLDGEGELTVQGSGAHRVFRVSTGITAELMAFTITGGLTVEPPQGSAEIDGAGVRNDGVLTLVDMVIAGNGGWHRDGGGVSVHGGEKVDHFDQLEIADRRAKRNVIYVRCWTHNNESRS